jgi:hypothetical protein
VAELVPDRRAAAPRAEHERPRRPQRYDGHHGVLGLTATDGVAVPGHRVPAVAVEAQPGRGERFAQLRSVVRVEELPGGDQVGVGQRVAVAVEADQPRHVDHPLVHLAALGPPRHLGLQVVKQRPGSAQPAGQQVYPRPAAEYLAGDHAAQRSEGQVALGRLVAEIEQRRLYGGAHAASLAQFALTFE